MGRGTGVNAYAGANRGATGKALVPIVNPNMSLIAAPNLDNSEDLRRLLDRQHR